MRADESSSKRHAQRLALKDFIDTLPQGRVYAIADWYARMKEMGLEHSDRQRLSELRVEGLLMDFNRKLKAYVYRGWAGERQLTFELVA